MPKTKGQKRFPQISLRRDMKQRRQADTRAVKRLCKEVAVLLKKHQDQLDPWKRHEVMPQRPGTASRYQIHRQPHLRYIDTNGALSWRLDSMSRTLPELPLTVMHAADLRYWRIDLEALAKQLRKL